MTEDWFFSQKNDEMFVITVTTVTGGHFQEMEEIIQEGPTVSVFCIHKG